MFNVPQGWHSDTDTMNTGSVSEDPQIVAKRKQRILDSVHRILWVSLGQARVCRIVRILCRGEPTSSSGVDQLGDGVDESQATRAPEW